MAARLGRDRTAGGIYDRTTDYIKFGQRWYNPGTGRFTQQDSIERLTDPRQGNRYPYAADNPVNNVDPTGASCLGATVEVVASFLIFAGSIFASPETFGGSLLIAGAALFQLKADVDAFEACF